MFKILIRKARRRNRAAGGIILSAIFLALPAVSTLNAQNSVLNYGAVGDGVLRSDGAMTAGSPVLTSISSQFSSADEGKIVEVIGAGPGGTSHGDGAMSTGSAILNSPSAAFEPSDVGRGIVVIGAGTSNGNLIATIQSYISPTSVTLSVAASSVVASAQYFYGAMTLAGTIQSVQNATTVTLSAPAVATVSAATFAYGTDDHAAFQSAVDAAGKAGGGVIIVPGPAECPSGATCGYMIDTTDQMTATAPGGVKIRYSGVSLEGDSSQPNLFCRGAWADYTNSVAFPGQTAEIRGNCLAIGDNGGPNGAAGEAVSNVTISGLHLYGMTNGNTFNSSFNQTGAPLTTTGDGWDETDKGIYMWNNSTFSNITIQSVIIEGFKGENIFSGGSALTGMVIENCTLKNFNSDGISMLAAGLQVLNNTVTNGSNAGIENSTVGGGSSALQQQVYQGNTFSNLPKEAIVVVGVDGTVPKGNIQILNNTFDTIGQINGAGAQAAVYIGSQGSSVAPANVTISGNTCHDCYSLGLLEASGNTQVSSNTFVVDKYPASGFMAFTNPMNGVTFTNNTGSSTLNAQSQGLGMSAVYVINPGWLTGNFAWTNVVLQGNSWVFPGVPQYEFSTTSGPGWGLVTASNLTWKGDSCTGCTHADVNHGVVNLSTSTIIEPYGPVVYVMGNSSAVTATVDASKEQDGAQVQIVNSGASPVVFQQDSNISLASPTTVAPGASISFTYSASGGRFALTTGGSSTTTPAVPAAILATAGTPQSTTTGNAFGTALQASVSSAAGSPLSGVTVTFTAPASGAGGTFGSSATATATTNSNGIATAPTLAANNQAGSFIVVASVAGLSSTASFNLTNTAASSGTGGSLSGSGNSSSAPINLTAEGTADWIHWGDSSLNRKTGVNAQISTYTAIGSSPISSYNNDPRSLSWTDGTPLASSTANQDGLWISGTGEGFSITAPADTTTRTLVVHVGGWYSGGTLTAHLSDGSATNYVDVTSPANGQFDRNYTLTYAAKSAAQTLTVQWVMTSGAGNVTLNGAALQGSTSSSATPPAAASLGVFAGNQQSATAGSSFAIPLEVIVQDSSGNPLSGITVTFSSPQSGPSATFSGGLSATAVTNLSGIATAPSLTANTTAGSYQVIASVAGLSATASFSLTNSQAASGGESSGTLVGIGNSATTSINLTTEGSADWIHWGDSAINRKAGVTSQISNETTIGSNAVSSYSNDPRPMSWTDGTPTSSSSSNADGIWISGMGEGFQITAPADTSTRTLSVHVGGWNSGGTLTASLSDGSAPVFTDITSAAGGQFDRNYTLTYSALSPGQTITVTWTMTSGLSYGNVTISGAALSTSSAPPPAQSGNGSLSGAGNSTAAVADLTTEGTSDWVHWGDGTLNRKAGVTAQIGNYTSLGGATASSYNNDPRPLTWADGTPLATSSANQDGIWVGGVNQGFSITAPADTTTRTLVVHVGGWYSGATLTAHLSDGSAADFVDVTPAANGQFDRNYSLTYSAKSAGQTLTVTWIQTEGAGNVSLSGAALQ